MRHLCSRMSRLAGCAPLLIGRRFCSIRRHIYINCPIIFINTQCKGLNTSTAFSKHPQMAYSPTAVPCNSPPNCQPRAYHAPPPQTPPQTHRQFASSNKRSFGSAEFDYRYRFSLHTLQHHSLNLLSFAYAYEGFRNFDLFEKQMAEVAGGLSQNYLTASCPARPTHPTSRDRLSHRTDP